MEIRTAKEYLNLFPRILFKRIFTSKTGIIRSDAKRPIRMDDDRQVELNTKSMNDTTAPVENSGGTYFPI